jgi:putative hemolysin
LIGALFACADTALTSLSSARLGAVAKQSEEPDRDAIERAVRLRPILQARYVIGRLASLGGSVALFTWWIVGWRAEPVGKALVGLLGLLALGALVQGATTFGRRSADRVVVIAVRFLRPLEWLLAPLATITHDLSKLVARDGELERDPRIAETEVEMMLDEGERSGALSQEPAAMMRNVLEFSELTAGEAMVPRTRVVFVDVDTPLADALEIIKDAGHSRYPVYRSHPDDVVGLLYAKDLFRLMGAGPHERPSQPDDDLLPAPLTVAEIIRSPIKLVYETQPLSGVLKDMRQSRQHLAVVVNEFGATIGIVTLEDVLEEIVGDIRDELDSEEAPIVELGDGRLVADATVLLSELSAYLGTEIDPDGDSDSLGGMLSERLGQVPGVGETVAAYGMRFIVRDADEKRVLKVEIVRPARPSMHPPGAAFSEPPPAVDAPTASALEPLPEEASAGRRRERV